MTASTKKVLAGIVVVSVIYASGILGAIGIRGFSAVEGMVSLLALLPIFMVGALIWFAIEVISSLRRIESAIAGESSMEPEFSRGS
ncbi:MAG: hypothetical protein HKN91_06290 [Acidimicrobiia bacterium]|nr:hypothetical protein [Acidimicrobiia bacterium]